MLQEEDQVRQRNSSPLFQRQVRTRISEGVFPRGCRDPEIAKMQTTAVIRAAINVKKAHADWNIVPEIMIPLIGDVKELKYVKDVVVATADAEIAAAGIDLKYYLTRQ